MSTRPLRNIFDTDMNSLWMLDIVKLRVLLDHARVTLKFIIYKTLTASAIIGAELCDEHVKEARSKQGLLIQWQFHLYCTEVLRAYEIAPTSGRWLYLPQGQHTTIIDCPRYQENHYPCALTNMGISPIVFGWNSRAATINPTRQKDFGRSGQWNCMCKAERTVQNPDRQNGGQSSEVD